MKYTASSMIGLLINVMATQITAFHVHVHVHVVSTQNTVVDCNSATCKLTNLCLPGGNILVGEKFHSKLKMTVLLKPLDDLGFWPVEVPTSTEGL